jgi:methyltransferase (TIGR00027 family)
LIREHPISQALGDDYAKARQGGEVAGMSNLMLIRTRFIDDHLKSALAGGAIQVVIMGAGFDTRAYRFGDLLKDKNVFEVDYRSTQDIKKCRLAAASIPIPPYVHFAEIDFKKDSLQAVLQNAGYRTDQRSFFIWEGVSMYLEEAAVRETLRTISRCSCYGSSLVMDFAETSMIDLLQKFPHLSQHNYTTRWGEPWIFGVPDNSEREFFQECGLELREILSIGGREARARYLTRSDGTKLGAVRGGAPSRRRLATTLKVIWMFLTRRSRWYALAKLDVR